MFTIGKKGGDLLSKQFNIAGTKNDVFDDLTFDNVAAIAEELMDLYAEGTYDKIDIIYNQFKNAATQIPKVEQFLNWL